MKKPTKSYLIDISHDCYSHASPYKFAKHRELGSPKYKEGVTTVLDWVNELCYHYLQQEKKIQHDFQNHIETKQKMLIETLHDNDYKAGIIKGFEIVGEILGSRELDNKR